MIPNTNTDLRGDPFDFLFEDESEGESEAECCESEVITNPEMRNITFDNLLGYGFVSNQLRPYYGEIKPSDIRRDCKGFYYKSAKDNKEEWKLVAKSEDHGYGYFKITMLKEFGGEVLNARDT